MRVGNEAWDQRQLDFYGALLDSAFTLRDQLGDIDVPHGHVSEICSCRRGHSVARGRPRNWETWGPARHYVHSKLMCWVALDRGIALVAQLGVDNHTDESWKTVRERCETRSSPAAGAGEAVPTPSLSGR